MDELAEEIKEDQELEPYFLDYIKYNLLSRELPEELPQHASEDEVTRYLKITREFELKISSLLRMLRQKYNIKTHLEGDNQQLINQLLNNVCSYYLDQYGREKIVARD
ncbi:MAG: hypothetical protein K9I94_05300 [Bacteroidales bacterium]|nr:hypothetical protein [Bacteroidales bacterium]